MKSVPNNLNRMIKIDQRDGDTTIINEVMVYLKIQLKNKIKKRLSLKEIQDLKLQ